MIFFFFYSHYAKTESGRAAFYNGRLRLFIRYTLSWECKESFFVASLGFTPHSILSRSHLNAGRSLRRKEIILNLLDDMGYRLNTAAKLSINIRWLQPG